MSNFNFKKNQLLVTYEPDPIQESNDPNEIIEVVVINKGDKCVEYEKGETLLVRRGYVEEIKSPHFKKNEKIIFDENKVMCKYQK
ncbi:MAG TPA: hypothetical protein VLA48_03185 [Nitrososphaeraceae archaeon]|nr:hypothetical protein [Nitrososphaeraceae archaeon]